MTQSSERTPGGEDVSHLQRFVEAQAGVYEAARTELAGGRKRTHWMWFIFPQIQGLGSSSMAHRFAISDLAEAAAYLQHPLLGARLRECTALVNGATGSVSDIFGYPDDLKFHSSVTLFHQAVAQKLTSQDPGDQVFAEALAKFFQGAEDKATLQRLAG